jgi:hypothetical protein
MGVLYQFKVLVHSCRAVKFEDSAWCMPLRAMSNLWNILSQKMTHPGWVSKSAVAREERISRRTVQRWCRLWETLPGRKDYPVTDAKGRVYLDGFRKFRTAIKQLERRGFPSGGRRGWSYRWERLIRSLRDRKAFGRTLEDRIKLIRAEIDAMSDREQMATLGELPVFFRSAVRQSFVGQLIKLLRDKPDNLT